MNTPADLAIQLCQLVLLLSIPAIAVASLTGLVVSFFQAVTQLQEQTLSFGIKLISVIVTILLTAGWLGEELIRFSSTIFDGFYFMVR
ncbi:MAG: type III secretion system export apparatus subunit SctS [Deltaproteobacteria bacterium]|jgi:type III secretion protein S|nr:type III secretion system export apparatus subunit SctS [Deltaproteobacteria bacterium]